MVLDLLVSEGVPVGFTQMSIEATMIGQEQLVGRQLGLQSPSAALSLSPDHVPRRRAPRPVVTRHLFAGTPQPSRGPRTLRGTQALLRTGQPRRVFRRALQPPTASRTRLHGRLRLRRGTDGHGSARVRLRRNRAARRQHRLHLLARRGAMWANLPSNMALPTVKPQTPASARVRIFSSLSTLPAAITGTSTDATTDRTSLSTSPSWR